nr:ATP synthase F0 subunit 8 [Melanetettix sp. n. XTW-2022a]
MPQMAPMWWTILMTMTIIMMMITIMMNYFNTNKKISTKHKMNLNYMPWKW